MSDGTSVSGDYRSTPVSLHNSDVSAEERAKAVREELIEEGRLPQDRPWKDGELLRELYEDRLLSANQIRTVLDCANATVHKWLNEHGIEKRTLSETQAIPHGSLNHVPFRTRSFGHEVWKHSEHTVLVHRLLAVAEYGLDALEGMQVHHENNIGWDNRPENITLVDPVEHGKLHKKVSGLDRLRLAELYENGDLASRPLAEHVEHDISSTTVLKAHKEFYGGDASA